MSLQSHPAPPGTGATPADAAGGRAQGPGPAALKGRNLGLLCDDPALPEALLAYRAAATLGAHVSLVRPRFGGDDEAHAVPETARMLGRLYDVIACVALPRRLVDALRDASGVPVVGDIEIDVLDPCDVDDRVGQRLLLWQRALVASLG